MKPSNLAFWNYRRHKVAVVHFTFDQTVGRLVRVLASTKDPWWVLGSAAVYLKGYDPGPIGDIDVLLSEADAQRVMSDCGLVNCCDGGTQRYRSAYVLRPDLGEMPVELLAGYEIFHNDSWSYVRPGTRTSIMYNNEQIFVPSDLELISIFEKLGRTKDYDRIGAMKAR